MNFVSDLWKLLNDYKFTAYAMDGSVIFSISLFWLLVIIVCIALSL
jgi:hypothetical protein